MSNIGGRDPCNRCGVDAYATHYVMLYSQNGDSFVSVDSVTLLHPGWLGNRWLACWTQAQKGPGSNRSRDAVG